jgi:phospholipid transport system substrate-binding protein
MTFTRADLVGTAAMSRRAALLGAAAALLASHAGHAALAALDGSPKDFIQRLGDQAVSILNEAEATPPQKLKQLKTLLDQSTDLDLVARLVLGRYWREGSEAQKQEYVRLFHQLVMQTMAERFSWYTGETFEIADAKPVDDRDTMVSTRILRPTGKPPILVDWRVRRSERGYLLIDIVAEGVSLVVTQRSEAAEYISRNGFDGLLQEMRDRVAKRETLEGT